MILRADRLPKVMRTMSGVIIERNEKGRVVKEYPVGTAKPGCAQHTHVTLLDKRRFCYDDGEVIEVVAAT